MPQVEGEAKTLRLNIPDWLLLALYRLYQSHVSGSGQPHPTAAELPQRFTNWLFHLAVQPVDHDEWDAMFVLRLRLPVGPFDAEREVAEPAQSVSTMVDTPPVGTAVPTVLSTLNAGPASGAQAAAQAAVQQLADLLGAEVTIRGLDLDGRELGRFEADPSDEDPL